MADVLYPDTPESKQAYFNEAVRYLRTMKKRAGDSHYEEDSITIGGIKHPFRPFVCKYLDDEGNRCVVGHFIPDNETEAFKAEGSVYDLAHDFPHLNGIAWPYVNDPVDNLDLPINLQRVHDHEENWGSNGLNNRGEEGLKELAAELGLIYYPPELSTTTEKSA